MKNLLHTISLSAKDFGKIHTIAVCGMLLALKMILGMFTVNVSSLLKIGFSFLPVAVAGMLFGPVAAGIVGAAGDIVSYFLQPTGPFFPGFTFSAFLAGFLYGLFLYRKPVSILRTLYTEVTVMLSVNILLTPLWLSMLYGKAFFAILAVRISANLLLLPVNAAMLYVILKVMEKSHVTQLMRNR